MMVCVSLTFRSGQINSFVGSERRYVERLQTENVRSIRHSFEDAKPAFHLCSEWPVDGAVIESNSIVLVMPT